MTVNRRLSCQERENLFRQIDRAQPLTRDQALVKASALIAQGLAEQLSTVIAIIARLDSELERLFAQHPDRDLFDSLPGAGEALAPRLATAFGSDRKPDLPKELLPQPPGVTGGLRGQSTLELADHFLPVHCTSGILLLKETYAPTKSVSRFRPTKRCARTGYAPSRDVHPTHRPPMKRTWFSISSAVI